MVHAESQAEALPKARKPKVFVVRADDWVAVYVNGVLRGQNHSLRPEAVLEFVGIEAAGDRISNDWLEENALPNNLRDIPSEAFGEDHGTQPGEDIAGETDMDYPDPDYRIFPREGPDYFPDEETGYDEEDD